MRHSECIILENSSGCVVKRGRLSGVYVTLSHFLGETLAEMMMNDEFPRGLVHVRIKREGFDIVAQKRFNDVKLIISYYENE